MSYDLLLLPLLLFSLLDCRLIVLTEKLHEYKNHPCI